MNAFRRMMFSNLAIVFSLILLGHCATWSSIHELPRKDWDFIIVGGGTAGSVLGRRLTENPKFNVLIIEAGPNNEGVLNSIVPGLQAPLQKSFYDWNYTTVPVKGLNGRVIDYPRGRMLGGSSSINGMVYTRGAASDYDRWANVTGDPGWSWNSLKPYIAKQEKWQQPSDNHNIDGQFDPTVHSLTGTVPVSIPGFPHPEGDAITLAAVEELGGEFEFNRDWNSGMPLGVGWLQATIGHDGTRSSAATSYLTTAVRSRDNLHIVTDTRVTRVLQTKGTKNLTMRTVEIKAQNSSETTLLTAKKEVILAAGSVGTPHILLHSGIGNRDDLEALEIPVVLDNPSVGQNLSDHTVFSVAFGLQPGAVDEGPWANLSFSPELQAEALELWRKNRTGPYVALVPVDLFGWVRIPDDSPAYDVSTDTSSGPHAAHIELVFGVIAGTYLAGWSFISPASRGSIAIRSNDPFEDPLIDPNYYDSDFDIIAAREGVKAGMQFAQAPTLRNITTGILGPLANGTTDQDIDEMLRDTSISAWHPIGTAAMSPEGADWGVVNPDLLVKNISGLRIVDASIMPFIPCAHTQAAVYFIAERGADLVKAAWK